MEGSLRNSDILAVLDTKVPARLQEIDRELAAHHKQMQELGAERNKLMRVQEAIAPETAAA